VRVPELPEGETVVRDLRPRLIGRRLAAVEVSYETISTAVVQEQTPALLTFSIRLPRPPASSVPCR
jgi:hypothetical protein